MKVKIYLKNIPDVEIFENVVNVFRVFGDVVVCPASGNFVRYIAVDIERMELIIN